MDRRARLEALFADYALTAPWTLCPMTTDLAKERQWLESWTDVYGVEGIVFKPLTSLYLPSYRGWTKLRRRDHTSRPQPSQWGPPALRQPRTGKACCRTGHVAGRLRR